MTHIFSPTLNVIFRVEGNKIWWWSSNRQVWFPEHTVSVAAIMRSLANGKATKVNNPEK